MSRARGFTFVEVLVSLVVGLLVLVGVHRLFVSGLKGQTATSLQTELNRKAQVALDDMIFWLRGSQDVLEGAADRVYFTDQSGDHTVRYWVSGGKLYRAQDSSHYSGGEVLASDVSQLVFSYQGLQGMPVEPARAKVVGIQLQVGREGHSAWLKSSVKLRNQ